MKRIIAALMICICPAWASSQVRGSVKDASPAGNGALTGASVYWAGTNIGVVTDAEGHFVLGQVKGRDRLVAAFVGYRPDTITVSGANRADVRFLLHADKVLDEVVVVSSQRGNYISQGGVLKGENITFAGLTKMACCNLAESFENSASVTVGYSDAITGARQIKMLGMAGIYTQMLDETRPIMRGLGAPYGLSYTPGMWLQGIQVAKGVTSVVGGHEAMSGQINLEYRKPTDQEPLFLNAYVDSDLRAELNAASSYQLSDKLSTVLLAHGSVDTRRADHNGDGYMDMPLGEQLSFANRWLYAADNGVQFRAGVKYTGEGRTGGDVDFKHGSHGRPQSIADPYGSHIRNQNLNMYAKLALPLGKFVYNEETGAAERSNLAFIADYNYHNIDSYYGFLKGYAGTQNSLYFNGMYSWNINVRNKLVAGASATADRFDERLSDATLIPDGAGEYELREGAGGKYMRRENEAGVFAEYSYGYKDRLTLIGGVRADYNSLHGWFYTPRAHVKVNITSSLILRGSAGVGYRSANIFSDNLWVMATGRTIKFEGGGYESLNTLEKSITYGGSLSWSFSLGRDDGASLSFDYFRSQFLNQVIADQEFDRQHVWFYNGRGKSYSNTYQVDFNWTPVRQFDVLVTFRYNDTAITLNRPDGTTAQVEKPLTDNFKGLVNLQYATRFRKWVFDFTAQINGRSRLPVLDGGALAGAEYSPVYPMFFAQVTHKFSAGASVYLGVENILDYRQHVSVLGGEVPYTPQFNSSVVWGPLMGRKIYLGARISF